MGAPVTGPGPLGSLGPGISWVSPESNSPSTNKHLPRMRKQWPQAAGGMRDTEGQVGAGGPRHQRAVRQGDRAPPGTGNRPPGEEAGTARAGDGEGMLGRKPRQKLPKDYSSLSLTPGPVCHPGSCPLKHSEHTADHTPRTPGISSRSLLHPTPRLLWLPGLFFSELLHIPQCPIL